MDNIIFGEALCPRVCEVHPTDDYKLNLTFTNGEHRLFNASSLLDLPAFASLKNKTLFMSVKVEYGTVVWSKNIDYCPDTLYLESVPVY